MINHLSDLSKEMIPAVEMELLDVLRLKERSDDLFYGMMHYHMGWVNEEMEPLDINSGKRVRPLLCLLACAASGVDWKRAIPAAASIEFIHNFSLIHDDIQDASPTRRGRLTVWKLWGVSQAINAGDAMFALAHTAMERLSTWDVDDSISLQALRMLDDTCLELTRGQFLDMQFEERDDVSVDDYLAMINGKTAALLSLSAEIGALVGDSRPDIVRHFAAFGRELGLAFQIRDDILGIWGDETVIGKSAATDIETRKKSLPVLHGLSKDETLRRMYEEEEDSSDEFVAAVVEYLGQTGSRKFAEDCEQKYADSALAHLEAISPEGKAGQALLQLTGSLLNRQF
jgi:geranylgeranyl diphosphate synthase type I